MTESSCPLTAVDKDEFPLERDSSCPFWPVEGASEGGRHEGVLAAEDAGALPLVRRVVTEVLEQFVTNGSRADFVSGVAYRIPGIIICELLGIPPDDRSRFLRWISTCFALAPDEEAQREIPVAIQDCDYVDDLLRA